MRVLVVRAYRLKPLLLALKSLLALFLIFVFAFYACGIYTQSERYISAMQELNTKKTVIIDAGHGGEDPGAVGVNGVYEKDLNLTFAFIIGELLEKEGYAVIYTRTEDRLMYNEDENIKGIRKISDLKNRCKIAEEYPEAIFVSIHMNSYSNARYSGLQVYYSLNNEESYSLASSVQACVKKELQSDNDRKIKKGESIYVLENTENPAVLIECGFLTNPSECEKLSEKEYQKSLSFAIVCGIIDYSNKNFKS